MRLWPGRRRVTVPVVRLQGTIGLGGGLRPGLSLSGVATGLKKAFAMRGPAVAIVVNSPGGSPAQSSLIYARIRALAEEHDKTVITFVEDVAASGGYWIAVAGDEIVADATSIVGSIGVVSAGFGFTELLEKIGVERRIYTTGENKVILDPFTPEKEHDIAILKGIQTDIQKAFVSVVTSRRGEKLADDPDLFTGRFWTGTAAQRLGLVDGLGEVRNVLVERYGKNVQLRPVPVSRPSIWRGRLGVAQGLSAESVIGAVRADRLWERFGL